MNIIIYWNDSVTIIESLARENSGNVSFTSQ